MEVQPSCVNFHMNWSERCQGLRPTHTLYGHQYYGCIGCLCLHSHCMSMETLATLVNSSVRKFY